MQPSLLTTDPLSAGEQALLMMEEPSIVPNPLPLCLSHLQEHEQCLVQRYPFDVHNCEASVLVLEHSDPDVVAQKPRVSKEGPWRSFCDTLTVAVMDQHRNVAVAASGAVKVSVQRYNSASSVFNRNTAPVLESPAEVALVQGRAVFRKLRCFPCPMCPVGVYAYGSDIKGCALCIPFAVLCPNTEFTTKDDTGVRPD